MTWAALTSGGKDSILALQKALDAGMDVSYMVTVVPENPDSYMFHSANLAAVPVIAERCGMTYVGIPTLGEKEDELQDLKVVQRKAIAQKIKEAREQGDLSENAEYDAAKDEQRDIEARIEQIEKILKNAEVVVEDEVDLDKISVGCVVKVLDVEFDEEEEFKLVGSSEANSLNGKISNESPVGKALIGARVGDTIQVETQAGTIEYKVLEIQRSK